MFRLKRKPLHPFDRIRTATAMVEFDILGYSSEHEGHAIMLKHASELFHGVVKCVEDVVGVGDPIVSLSRLGNGKLLWNACSQARCRQP